jgi:CRISPR-associated protein (TIGR03986 family)
MPLTPEELKQRQVALWRAQGMSEAEIERRLTSVTPDPQSGNHENGAKLGEREGRPRKGARVQRQGRRPKRGDIPFDGLSQPYRFIALPDQVMPPETTKITLDEPVKDGYCAVIKVDWVVETPLLVGGLSSPENGETRPLTIGSQYVLPGSTLRGLLRNAVEIVAHGKMTQGNWHYRFGLRDFVHPYYKDEARVSKLDDVRAGFLRVRDATAADAASSITANGKVWELTPAANDGKWGHVEIASLSSVGVSSEDLKGKGWIEKSLKDKYRALGMVTGDRISFKKKLSFKFLPEENGRKVYAAQAHGKGDAEGVMLVAGRLPGGGNKKFEYFVTRPSDNNARRFTLASHVVTLFERLYSEPARGDRPRPTGNWRELKPVAESDDIPVFYVGDPDPKSNDSNFFFGLTRLFKIPHKLSVGQILHETQPAHVRQGSVRREGDSDVLSEYANVDFVENLFGYVVEPRDLVLPSDSSVAPEAVARKGRIAFGFAFLNDDTPARLTEFVKCIQMAPRPSFAPFYLRGTIKDYSGGSPRLAGRKTYFPRYQRAKSEIALADFKKFGDRQIELVKKASKGHVSQDVLSNLSFLVPAGEWPLTFTGEIRMHNVTAAEIGAVLYALTHAGDCAKRFRHLIGRGKPFGAGQVRVGKILLQVEANKGGEDTSICPPAAEEKFNPATGKGLADEKGHSLAPFLTAFETYLCEQLGLHAAADSPTIREWLGMSDPAQGEAHARADRLFYHPFEKDGSGESISPFVAYKRLREATQSMATADPPQGPDRLLAAPQVRPPKSWRK